MRNTSEAIAVMPRGVGNRGDGAVSFSTTASLLLACCHTHLDSARIDHLQRCASAIDDWNAVVDQASHHFVSALVYRHLSRHCLEIIPPAVLSLLHEQSMRVATNNLRMLHDLQVLEQDFLAPLAIRFLVFKGLTLGQRYYGNLTLRHARDIDILILAKDLYPLACRLRDAGYRLKSADLVVSEEDIRQYCATIGEVKFISPKGTIIELHQKLDFTGAQYPVSTEWLFTNSESETLGRHSYEVMSTTDLFIYICYHHARHQWSRLHWVADLSAVSSHPSFDLPATRKRASELGLLHLVEASLHLKAVLLDSATQAPPSRFAATMVRQSARFLWARSLPPEIARESLLTKTAGIFVVRWRQLVWNWQVNSRYKHRFSYLRFILKPSYMDYLFAPLPKPLSFLYVILRPTRWLWEGIREYKPKSRAKLARTSDSS